MDGVVWFRQCCTVHSMSRWCRVFRIPAGGGRLQVATSLCFVSSPPILSFSWSFVYFSQPGPVPPVAVKRATLPCISVGDPPTELNSSRQPITPSRPTRPRRPRRPSSSSLHMMMMMEGFNWCGHMLQTVRGVSVSWRSLKLAR